MDDVDAPWGQVVKAPENFLARDDVHEVFAQARAGRRDFLRTAFVAAAGGAGAAHAATTNASTNATPATTTPANGDPAILNLPAREIAGFPVQALVLTAVDSRGEHTLLIPERPVPDGTKVS